jgi:DNA-binding LacI/PurR family transcriptional regulator
MPDETEGRPGARRRATSYDVARTAGVSQSAVSRCFTPGASISPVLRDKILAAARGLSYRPNAIARGLTTKRCNLVAVLITATGNLYYPELLFELSNRFSARGSRVLLFSMDSEEDAESVLSEVWSYQVDGIVSVTSLSDARIGDFRAHGVPVVLYNRLPDQQDACAVLSDNEQSGFLAADTLLAAGHRRFGVIQGAKISKVVVQRVNAAVERLKAAGVTDIVEVDGQSTYEGGAAALGALLAACPRRPSAIIIGNDPMAMGAMDEARYGLGLKIPSQLSIISFDGMPPAQLRSYDLCTVRQPTTQMAEAVVELLMNRIENPQLPSERRFFSGSLIRGSSAKLSS